MIIKSFIYINANILIMGSRKATGTWTWILIILILMAIGVGAYFWITGGGVNSIYDGGNIQPPALPN